MQCPPARCPGTDRRCRCGIYAFRSEQRAWGESPPPSRWQSLWADYTVLVEVALWGKVVEQAEGLARRYDVEVELRPPVTCKVFA